MSRMTQKAKRISRRVPVPDPPTTSDDRTELEDRQNHHLLTESLGRCQVALTEVRQAIRELISRQECLERYYRRRGPMPESGYFYLPTADQHGLRIDDENDESRLPDREQSVRRHVAEFVVLLRFKVDHALEVAPQVASHADSPSLDMDSRWTHRLIGTLREVRGAILSGVEGRDVFPSALMIPDAGGLETLVALYLKLGAFLEDLGRAASYGSDLPSQASVVQERLLQENEALKEELEDLERKHQSEQMPEKEFLRLVRLLHLQDEGLTQKQIAVEYTSRFGERISQPTVSRVLREAHDTKGKNGGVAGRGRTRIHVVDPSKLDQGGRRGCAGASS